jgi:hypothetical protein
MDYTELLKKRLSASGTSTPKRKPEPKKPTIPGGRIVLPQENNDPDDDYESLHDQDMKEKIRKNKIANEKELGNLFLKTLFQSLMGEVGQSIQTNFVDIPRRDSARLAAEWGIPGKERTIEKDLSDIIKTAIESMERDIERLIDDGVFD